MIIYGTIIAFIAATCWSISIFPFTKAGRIMSVPVMNIIRLGLGTILILSASLIFEPGMVVKVFSGEYLQGWLWLGISGVLALSLGDFLSFKMYTILSPRYGSVLTTLSPASALIAGIILLSEHINWIGITGMLITIIGVVTMSLGRKERSNIPDHGHGSILSGVMYGIIGALCSGAGLACSKLGFVLQALNDHPIEPLTGGFIRFLVASTLIFILMILRGKFISNFVKLKQQPSDAIGAAVAGTIFGPLLGVGLAMICIQYIDVAVAQTIFALVPVFALIISRIFYKEKITRAAVGGVAMAIAGVVLLIWRESLIKYFS